MKKLTFLIYLILLSPTIVLGESVEIYIRDQLDEPRGYCLDIKGYKLKAKINNGLQAHTCYSYQGEIAVDQAFDSLKLTKNQFFLPVFDVCMESGSIAVSAPIRLNKCNYGKLQDFKLDIKGRIYPSSDTKLCLTVEQGQSKKGGGGSPVHLKRNLTLQPCSIALRPYQIWSARKSI
jgi:hypothetical protein